MLMYDTYMNNFITIILQKS